MFSSFILPGSEDGSGCTAHICLFCMELVYQLLLLVSQWKFFFRPHFGFASKCLLLLAEIEPCNLWLSGEGTSVVRWRGRPRSSSPEVGVPDGG